jgi:hypothetical protein
MAAYRDLQANQMWLVIAGGPVYRKRLVRWTILPQARKTLVSLVVSFFLQPPLGNETTIIEHTSYLNHNSPPHNDCVSALPYLSFTKESCGSLLSQEKLAWH